MGSLIAFLSSTFDTHAFAVATDTIDVGEV